MAETNDYPSDITVQAMVSVIKGETVQTISDRLNVPISAVSEWKSILLEAFTNRLSELHAKNANPHKILQITSIIQQIAEADVRSEMIEGKN
jgi:hypothetical protein